MQPCDRPSNPGWFRRLEKSRLYPVIVQGMNLEKKSAVFIFMSATIAITLLQPAISINDCDAQAYIMGANSIHNGAGYVDTTGHPLNHWPPGYSLMLAVSSHPKTAALAINYISFGLVLALLYTLAVQFEWPRLQALAMAVAIGFGFLYHLAVEAKPDVFTYAVFLLGVKLHFSGEWRWRVLGSLFLSALIPIKLIATAFVPGLFLAELYQMRGALWVMRRTEWLAGGCFWLLFTIGVVLFNRLTVDVAIPATHAHATVVDVFREVGRFIIDSLRGGVACWYGSIRAPIVFVPFAMVLAVGLASLAVLKASPDGAAIRWAGMGVLGVSWVLECVRQFFAGPRLMAYGVLLLLLGFRPRKNVGWLWPVYGVTTLALTMYNCFSTVQLGINHPEYRRVADSASRHIPRGKLVFTNANRLLDVQEKIPSQTVTNLEGLPEGAYYLAVTLPNYDAIDHPIGDACRLDKSWKTISSFEGGVLYQKISSTSQIDGSPR
jgi:hypothetical protein